MLSVYLSPGAEERYFRYGADTVTAAIFQRLLLDESANERFRSGLGSVLFDTFANDVDHVPKMNTARVVGTLQTAFFHFVELPSNSGLLSFVQ